MIIQTIFKSTPEPLTRVVPALLAFRYPKSALVYATCTEKHKINYEMLTL